ncbi:uncharacterized protein LOC112169503 [Rosa chinensis]|nr:uncharacterized protein LOC112169503 [Rosa chinensis]
MQKSGLVSNGNGTNWKPEDQYINFGSSASASVSSADVMIAFKGQMGNYGGYGSMNTEIETLPLFPMHNEDIFGNMKTSSEGGGGYSYYSCGWGGYNGDSHISLELSLNSYDSTLFSRERVFSVREETKL